MVVGVTVAESVVANIITSLEEIDGAPFDSHDLHVYQMGGNLLDVPFMPCAILLDMGTKEDDRTNPLISVVHEFAVVVGLRPVGQSWAERVRAILADVTSKLREDWTRGGVALTTRVEAGEVWDSASDGIAPVAGGQVSLSVIYRHLYSDPTTAI